MNTSRMPVMTPRTVSRITEMAFHTPSNTGARTAQNPSHMAFRVSVISEKLMPRAAKRSFIPSTKFDTVVFMLVQTEEMFVLIAVSAVLILVLMPVHIVVTVVFIAVQVVVKNVFIPLSAVVTRDEIVDQIPEKNDTIPFQRV